MEGATASETATGPASHDGAPATDTATLEVRRPADGSLIRELADRLARARRRGGRQGPRGAAGMGGDRHRRPPPLARPPARLDDRQSRSPRRRDAGGDRQGPRRGRARSALLVRHDQLLRRARRRVPGRGDADPAHPAVEGEAAAHRLPPVSGGRRDQPLELPADPRLRRRDSGAGRRLRGGHQALGVHPALDHGAGPGVEGGDRRPRGPRRGQRHRRDGRSAGRRGRLRPVHRLRPDRQGGDEARRRHPDPGQPRARRQGPADRPARRGPRARRQRDRHRRPRQHRADLHVDRARLRRGADLRRVRGQAGPAGAEAPPGHRRPFVRRRPRRDDHPGPGGDRRRPRRGRPPQGRHGSSPAASARRAPATGTSRR